MSLFFFFILAQIANIAVIILFAYLSIKFSEPVPANMSNLFSTTRDATQGTVTDTETVRTLSPAATASRVSLMSGQAAVSQQSARKSALNQARISQNITNILMNTQDMFSMEERYNIMALKNESLIILNALAEPSTESKDSQHHSASTNARISDDLRRNSSITEEESNMNTESSINQDRDQNSSAIIRLQAARQLP